MTKKLAWLASALLLIYLVASYAYDNVDLGCRNTVLQTAAAPAGDRKAVMFERDCGATTAYSTQVSILPSGKKLNGAGNVFVIEGPWARITWLSPDVLLIQYDDQARVFHANEAVAGVTIRYEKVHR